MSKQDKCKDFRPVECVNGHCPDIPTEYDDREFSNGISCEECWYNTYRCEDCLFLKTEYCPKESGG